MTILHANNELITYMDVDYVVSPLDHMYKYCWVYVHVFIEEKQPCAHHDLFKDLDSGQVSIL